VKVRVNRRRGHWAKSAVIEPATPYLFSAFHHSAGGNVSKEIPTGYNALLYLISGELRAGAEQKRVPRGQMAQLGDGDTVRLAVAADAAAPADFLLLAASRSTSGGTLRAVRDEHPRGNRTGVPRLPVGAHGQIQP